MRTRPILFSGLMVRALLAGTKTQTRRVIKRPLKHPGWTEYCYFGPSKNDPNARSVAIECGPDYPDTDEDVVPCPYGAACDLLWVRETWAHVPLREADGGQGDKMGPIYRADGDEAFEAIPDEWNFIGPWRPSIHMPRWASRLTLRIRGVRVERLQDISTEDAEAEGWPGPDDASTIRSAYPIAWYSHLWEQINGAGSWAVNPWVWVIEFDRVSTQQQ